MTDTVTIARKDLEAALEHLGWSWDEGPIDEGWQSPELKALVKRLEELLGHE